MLYNASFCTCWASNLWVHNSTHSLVASSIFLSTDTSLSISLTIPSSSSQCMNCSFHLMSYSLSAHPLLGRFVDPVFSLKYCSNNTFLLWCSLILWHSMENSAFAVLHFSFSSFVNFIMSCRLPHLTSS